MIRSLAVLAVLAAGLGAVTAQEITPPAATMPAPADITINPAAPIDATPKQANLLTGMYATKAVIELCALTIEDGITTGMTADQKRLETSLGMDAATATSAYDKVKADVEKTTPDCTEGSADRLGVDAVTDIYKTSASAPAAGTTSPAAPATPAPAAPTP